MSPPGAQHTAPRPLLGVGAMLGASLGIAVSSLCVKFVFAHGATYVMTLAGRFVLMLLFVLPLLAMPHNWRAVVRADKRVHAEHLTLTVASIACFYYAIGHLPLAFAASINFTMPIWVALLSASLLGERIPPRRLAWLALGFAGVLCILRPGSVAFGWAGLVSLGGAILGALVVVLTRRMPVASSHFAVLFYPVLGGALCFALLAPFAWQPIASAAWGYLAAAALLAIGVQFLLSLAYRRGRTPLVTGLDYLRLIWSGLLAWIFFSELPDAVSLVGMLLVVGSGLGILGGEVRTPPPRTAQLATPLPVKPE